MSWIRFASLLRFIGRSVVDGINYSCLSRNLGITKYKAEQYVGGLEQALFCNGFIPRAPTCCASRRS